MDPPPKAVKVTMSKRVPLVGDELKAYDEEQEKIKKEEAVKKASIIKVEEVRAASSHLSESSKGDSMVIDPASALASSEGKLLNSKIKEVFEMLPFCTSIISSTFRKVRTPKKSKTRKQNKSRHLINEHVRVTVMCFFYFV